jgi:hypothetical protein
MSNGGMRLKPPQYEEMDRGREEAIPMAFQKVCARLNRYRLKINPPVQPPMHWTGPLPRQTFEVMELGEDTLVAEFYPNGHYRCYRPEFQPYFEKMEDIIEKAGQQAYEAFMARYEEMRGS